MKNKYRKCRVLKLKICILRNELLSDHSKLLPASLHFASQNTVSHYLRINALCSWQDYLRITKLEFSPRILFCFSGSDKELRLPVEGQRGTQAHVGVM